MQRAISQGGLGATIAWVLGQIAAHNGIVVPDAVLLATATGITTLFAGAWRHFVLGEQ